jgi:hypothetical protein
MFKFFIKMKVGAANISKNAAEMIELGRDIRVERKEQEVELTINGKTHVF